ncbi:hypothetical protein DL764_003927 [Monosporascus ibericus]|uniref:FAD-binding domain-containing protein n=1 Tax=Monosporascus ibericus TaxID=155417 RepID=A0A4Q4TEN4_9PEZI|nr:hypothetical protein DL764_003927 [Monosporascus ibericus]
MITERPSDAKPKALPRVIIGGGSIMGLSLALMLEKVGVDFVVLEAHDSVVPQVGAGVGCNANGMRILDQLGVCDDIMKVSTEPLQEVNTWWPDGSLHTRSENYSDCLEQMTGYPMVMLDRQQLLRILHSHIREKTKVIPGARIVSVSEDHQGVHVTTSDGRQFTGDILVGADGSHSFVRQEMWRLARLTTPGYFRDDEINNIKCNWITLFGISTLRDPRITPGSVNTTFGHRMSYGLVAGGNGRNYYFLNQSLPRELEGREIRRYTEASRDALAKEHWNDFLQHDIRFADLFESSVRAVLVPLQRYIFPKWHYGRIMTLGDAAHKLHVVTGHGAMMCIEDAAVFVNQLMKQLQEDPSSSLGLTQIHEVFVQTQNLRESRSRTLMKQSFLTQALHSWTNPLLKFVAVHLMPWLGFDFVLAQVVDALRPAPRLEALPLPPRKKLVGFDDEHPEPPSAARPWLGRLVYSTLILCAMWAVNLARNSTYADAGMELDRELAQVNGPFRLDMAGTLIVMLIEGWRRANKTSILQWPMLWALTVDLAGFQVVAPFFYLVNYWITSRRGRIQFTDPSRPIILSAAKAIFPVAILLYMFPIAMTTFTSQLGMASRLAWVGALSSLPSASCTALATMLTSMIGGEKDTFFGQKHLKYTAFGYKCMFGTLALLHLASLGWQIKNKCILWPLPVLLAEFAWLLGVCSDVCHYNQIRNGALYQIVLITLGFILVGPGATVMAVWHWREEARKQGREKCHQHDALRSAKSSPVSAAGVKRSWGIRK